MRLEFQAVRTQYPSLVTIDCSIFWWIAMQTPISTASHCAGQIQPRIKVVSTPFSWHIGPWSCKRSLWWCFSSPPRGATPSCLMAPRRGRLRSLFATLWPFGIWFSQRRWTSEWCPPAVEACFLVKVCWILSIFLSIAFLSNWKKYCTSVQHLFLMLFKMGGHTLWSVQNACLCRPTFWHRSINYDGITRIRNFPQFPMAMAPRKGTEVARSVAFVWNKPLFGISKFELPKPQPISKDCGDFASWCEQVCW